MWKFLVAQTAFIIEGFFSCVRKHVPFQIRGILEFPSAKTTFMAFSWRGIFHLNVQTRKGNFRLALPLPFRYFLLFIRFQLYFLSHWKFLTTIFLSVRRFTSCFFYNNSICKIFSCVFPRNICCYCYKFVRIYVWFNVYNFRNVIGRRLVASLLSFLPIIESN